MEDAAPAPQLSLEPTDEALPPENGMGGSRAAVGRTTLRAGEAFTFAYGAEEAWELCSGWVGLFDTFEGIDRPVAIALPGDILSRTGLSGIGATCAVCLGDVTAVPIPTAIALSRDGSRRDGTERREMFGPVRVAAGTQRPVPQQVLATLISAMLERRRRAGKEGPTILLPVARERLATGIGTSSRSLLGVFDRLVESRVLRCVLETPTGIVVQVMDTGALRMLAGPQSLPAFKDHDDF